MNVDSVSFGAVPINSIKVKKYNKLAKRFVDYPVHFVKIDAYNRNDLDTIYKTALKWKKWEEAKYVQQISTSCQWMKKKPIDIYALTSQKSNFEKLRAENILGLAEMRPDADKSENMVLRYLQVRPNAMNINQTNKKNYKYVGSTIINSLKRIYSDISLYADKDINVENFYKKNGFVEDFKGSSHFAWHRSPIKKIMHRIMKFRLETGI